MRFEFSSGGVVFKKGPLGQIYWLVALSSPSKEFPESYWRLPKGWLDDDGDKPGVFTRGEKKADETTLREAAQREVKEEGGVEAEIIKKIGTEKLFFTKSGEKTLKFVTFYLMKWKEDVLGGPGFETSEVGWFPFKESKEKLKYKSEKEVLQKAKEILASGTQESLI